MAAAERVTVTLPAHLVQEIDRFEQNRSRFISVAVEHELARRRQESLQISVNNPHSDATELAEMGLAEWGLSLPADDEGLVDISAGKAVHWIEGRGWIEDSA